MPLPLVSKILKDASEIKDKKKRIEFIVKHRQNNLLLTLLKYCFDEKIEFALPEGKPPYKPCEFLDQESRLYQETRRLYLFIKGGNDNLHPIRRETLFIQLLESIHPDEAELLIHIKDKKLPYRNINVNFVKEAFPGLI
jgi:hypothetical protein